ncbi:MAG: hypothetical protein IJM64_00860 [Ottowia sp.]|nr:hypothetical protein [Ottowia sp.]
MAVPENEVTLEFAAENVFPDGGSCPADISLSVGGRSVSIDAVSKMCIYIEQYVRPIAHLLGTIFAMMIVSGAFKE